MNAFRRLHRLALMLCISLVLLPLRAAADDIDIFVGSSAGSSASPNVLIVLDNTSNWARQSQQWPGGIQQGQAEVDAIKTVVNSSFVTSGVNIGLMEFVTNGTANQNGGFIRFAVQPMTDAAKSAFSTKLDTAFNNITGTAEKRNSNTPYGNLMYDAYNYFAGAGVSNDGQNTTASLSPPNNDVDPNGYVDAYSRFKSPLSAAHSCARTYVIFIGNPNASGPASDDAANTAALAALGGNSATTQLALPNFALQADPLLSHTTLLGDTAACYPDAACSGSDCPTARAAAQRDYGWGWDSNDTICKLYTGSGSGTDRIDTFPSPYTNPVSCTGQGVATRLDYQAQCSTYSQGCYVGAVEPNPVIIDQTTGTTPYLASAPATTLANPGSGAPAGTAGALAGLTCPGDAVAACTYTAAPSQTYTSAAVAATGIETNSCYWDGTGSKPAGYNTWSPATNDFGAATCPANYTCSYAQTGATDRASCTANHTKKAVLTQTLTPYKNYSVTQYASKVGGACPVGEYKLQVVGANAVFNNVATNTNFADTGPRNADEWARFMFGTGVPVAGADNQPITTYTIDVYNAQPNNVQTSLLLSMAKAGGGRYFNAKSEQAIIDALKLILAEIQSVNSTFASASLPVNATNRTQNANQVFIGMFRPAADPSPRWFGNLKQYAIGRPNGVDYDLIDINGLSATNSQTGFLSDCATSWWTSSSATPDAWARSAYWYGISDNPAPSGRCPTSSFDRYSDSPDGSFVEKGAVAEVLRKGNNPPYADNDTARPTWSLNRTLYTCGSASCVGAPVPFNGVNVPSLSANALNFTSGVDVNNETNLATGIAPDISVRTRPSIHGDVIHSRPLPLNYGVGGVTVYYGSNDGTLRAVESYSGKELWAFIAPEFASAAASRNPTSTVDPLTRLMNNSPLINYSNVDPSLHPLPKDYFFDGSLGVFQNLDNTKVWIYPTMRRGGRMIYALDVTNNAAPVVKWRRGCPNFTNDAGCISDGSHDISGIGQTWSTPNIGFVKGYSVTTPVAFVGGGYDACEDVDTATPACGSAKGRAVYMIDGDTGAILATFATTRSVAADVALVDVDNDGYVDYAYAADTGGSLYRIDLAQFARDATSGAVSYTALGSGGWSIHRVAYTAGSGRKFLFAPVLFPLAGVGQVFVGIGSGDREHPLVTNYPFNVLNRFYVYLDNLGAVAANNMDDTAVFDNFTNSADVAALIAANNGNCTANNFANGKKGWFVDLNQYGAGEQTVTSGVIAGGVVYFSTNRPIPPNSGSCSSALGEARGYALDLFNASGAIGSSTTCGGSRSNVFAGGGLPPSPVVGTVPIDGVPTTVCIGCVSRDCTGSNCSTPFTPGNITPNIVPIRKRVYQYSSGADNK